MLSASPEETINNRFGASIFPGIRFNYDHPSDHVVNLRCTSPTPLASLFSHRDSYSRSLSFLLSRVRQSRAIYRNNSVTMRILSSMRDQKCDSIVTDSSRLPIRSHVSVQHRRIPIHCRNGQLLANIRPRNWHLKRFNVAIKKDVNCVSFGKFIINLALD